MTNVTNEKKKLMDEVDELQGFINTCEVALDYGLGLDEATYDKYPFDFMKGIRDESQGVHYRLEGYLFPDTYEFYIGENACLECG